MAVGRFGDTGCVSTKEDKVMVMRIIPRLDIKGPNLVKGVQLEGLRVLGKPWWFARHYYEQGADELIYMDAVASLYDRNSLLHFVKQTSREIFIPITIGGGLRSLSDIREVLSAGADKVSINTAAVKNPQLIREAANRFGSSTIVINIEAQRHENGAYEAYIENGREPTGKDVFKWAQEVVELGAGEILLTSISLEGTCRGYDLELIRRVAGSVSIPVIAMGGAGSKDHVLRAITDGHADAVGMASILHYDLIERRQFSDDDFRDEGNITFLKSRRAGYRAEYASIPAIRDYLAEKGITCRRTSSSAKSGKDQKLRSEISTNESNKTVRVAVINYGMGNLFSVKHACETQGMEVSVVGEAKELMVCDVAILPGVGAFGDAMDILHKLDLVSPIKDFAAKGKLLFGICLGQQLLMSESCEFGNSKGLDIFAGTVERFDSTRFGKEILKVPHIGWNRIYPTPEKAEFGKEADGCYASDWNGTPLEQVPEGANMYFVHSYYVMPEDNSINMSYTTYGDRIFCSSLGRDNVMGFQFHPERSGVQGLIIYRAIASLARNRSKGGSFYERTI